MNPKNLVMPDDYGKLYAEIKERVRAAQYDALRAVNKELVAMYWDIGRLISQRQAGGSWGKSVVERLAADLQAEFPGSKGFSIQNVWYMRQFYLAYHASAKLQPLVGERNCKGNCPRRSKS
jgi:predicted nuclease of restriction endonuclease-like (RecB) superfamily